MKKFLSVLLALCLFLGVSGCGLFGGDGLIDPKTDAIYPNRWYTTKVMDGIESYNCVVVDAFSRAAGGVFTTYVPFCNSCHTQGDNGSGILDAETPYESSHYCTGCGAHTPIHIRYNP